MDIGKRVKIYFKKKKGPTEVVIYLVFIYLFSTENVDYVVEGIKPMDQNYSTVTLSAL